MSKQVFMLSGIPRSGSTVLASLLSQHPSICTTTTSPVLDLINIVRNQWPVITGNLLDQNPNQLRNILSGVFESSYKHIEQDVILDKHREWPRHIKFLTELNGTRPKIICTVRDIAEVMASFVLLIERNKPAITYIDQELIDLKRPINNQNRCRLMWEKYINVPWTSLKLGWEYDRSSMLFLDYKDIVEDPHNTMSKVCDFLEVDGMKTIDLQALAPKPENDQAYGLIGLHDIRSELKRSSPPAEEVLGLEITNYYRSMKLDFWNHE